MRSPCFKKVFAWRKQTEACQSAFRARRQKTSVKSEKETFSTYMGKRVKTGCLVELWTTRRPATVVENSCAKQDYMLRTWVPNFCTKGIVRKSPSGNLLEKNQELTWWPKKRSWLPPSSFWTTKTAVSNMKVTDCKAEWYSIHLRWARALG